MKNFKNIYFTIIAILSLATANAQISKAEIRATGLTCSMCSNAINKQLKSLPEVANVDTDLNTNTFFVTLKKNNSLSPKIFKEKVEKAGFFIGSLIVTMKSENINNKKFILINDVKANGDDVKVQIMDKDYVTAKEYKKLLKSLKSITTYSANNQDDFHVKIVN